MSDDQFRELRTLILDLSVRIEELKLTVRSLQKAEEQRHTFLVQHISQPVIEIVSPDGALKKLFDPDQN